MIEAMNILGGEGSLSVSIGSSSVKSITNGGVEFAEDELLLSVTVVLSVVVGSFVGLLPPWKMK